MSDEEVLAKLVSLGKAVEWVNHAVMALDGKELSKKRILQLSNDEAEQFIEELIKAADKPAG
jgi:hypothetical protein